MPRRRRFPPTLDRRDDQVTCDRLALKPPVLGRGTLSALCLAALALVVYGTVGPLGLGGDPWLAVPSSWSWLPPAVPTDYNDIFTNLVVYVPVGLALRLLLRRRGFAGVGDLTAALLLAALLSYATEVFQQFMPARSANRVDVLINTLGATLGCALAPQAQRFVRSAHAAAFTYVRTRRWTVLACGVSALTVLMMTIPFDFAWTAFNMELGRPFELLDVRRAAMFAAVALTLAMSIFERSHSVGRATHDAICGGLALGLCLEYLQIFLISHEGDIVDVLTIAAGVLIGCAAARRMIAAGLVDLQIDPLRPKERPPAMIDSRRLGRRLAAAAVVATVGLALLLTLVRMPAYAIQARESAVLWLPFQLHFLKTFDRVLVDVFEALLLNGLLTGFCLYMAGRKGVWLSLWLVCSLVGLAQMTKLVVGGVADITSVLLALLAWALTVRVWRVLRPARRADLGDRSALA